jgi:hypothetical protein
MNDIDHRELRRLITEYIEHYADRNKNLADTPLPTEPQLHTRED